jgi:hypothetical protein
MKAVYLLFSHKLTGLILGECWVHRFSRDLKAAYISHQHTVHHLGESRALKFLGPQGYLLSHQRAEPSFR